ncbi:MAG: phospholipase D-like domain-containing protein [Myxococcota bacterium]|nr:phospholipase D-like domain-containing protein [Myxococcota bacterium]
MKCIVRACLLLSMALCACSHDLDDKDKRQMTTPKVEVFFNFPGSRQVNGINTEADDVVVQLIDRANATIDFSVMGFSRKTIIDALDRAFLRGVQMRFVGNSRHAFGRVRGYETLDRINVDTQVGNQTHIMHDKFFIIDKRITITGTGNITSTGFNRNDNNWVLIDSPQVAADFTDEFEQMYSGRFGYSKKRINNDNQYAVGDHTVEVYFSPQEDCMGRILEAVEAAEESIEFFIFAFTKDQVGSLFIAKQQQFDRYNRCCGPSKIDLSPEEAGLCAAEVQCQEPYRRKYVRGVIDRSQLHSNGPYHEVYRLLAFGIDVRMDGNDNSRQPGDYQAGGGRQHSKTMILDGGTESPVVVTGSFNWSSSATVANDETLLVISGKPVGRQYFEYFDYLWRMGKDIGNRYIGDAQGLQAQDVIFNEIQWDGFTGDPVPLVMGEPRPYQYVDNEEFIELLNTTDRVIDLSMWTIASDDDFVTGLYPGTVIGPYERFLILAQNTPPYDELIPQDRGGAYVGPDFVMNTANDDRFLRLNLRNARFRLRLLDPFGQQVDVAGNGLAPFHGGREFTADGGQIVRSMERKHPIGDGADPASWKACVIQDQDAARQSQVVERFRGRIHATPGQSNSGGEEYPDEDPNWRRNAGGRCDNDGFVNRSSCEAAGHIWQ